MKSVNKGFTLIELLVVISIIGMLSSVVLAGLSTARGKAVIARSLTFSTHIRSALSDDLRASYTFDNPSEWTGTSVKNEWGNDLNLTLVLGATWSPETPTGSGRSLRFNSTSARAEFPAPYINPDRATACGEITISAWINTTKSVGQQTIFSNLSDGNIFLGIQNSSGKLLGYVNGVNALSSSAVNDGKWRHVVWSNDCYNSWIYVDGSKDPGSPIAQTRVAAQANSSNIGYGTGDFVGWIDEFRVYYRKLTLAEVHQIYAQGLQDHTLAEK